MRFVKMLREIGSISKSWTIPDLSNYTLDSFKGVEVISKYILKDRIDRIVDSEVKAGRKTQLK